MANRFRVKVVVIAKCDYEVEVEAYSSHQAEKDAIDMWREKTPSDFQIDKVYIDDFETDDTEQIEWDCHQCGKEITKLTNDTQDEMCDACFEEAEES